MTDFGEQQHEAEEMIARLMDAIKAGDRLSVVDIAERHPLQNLPVVVMFLASHLVEQEAESERLLTELESMPRGPVVDAWRIQKARADRAEAVNVSLRRDRENQAHRLEYMREELDRLKGRRAA